MKGIILAAGAGRRLAPLGWDKPKCLLPFGALTLLDNIVLSLARQGIDDLTIVLGYQRELVEERMAAHSARWTVVFNEQYAATNTINSLWLARRSLDDDFVYFNADVLFDRRIIPLLLGYTQTALAVDAGRCGQEEVKVVVDGAGRIVRIGKALDPAVCLGEFIGVGKFCRGVCPLLLDSLARYNEHLGQKNLFFEAAVDDILAREVFQAAPIGNLRAIEIDSPDDYHRAQAMVEQGLVADWPAQQ